MANKWEKATCRRCGCYKMCKMWGDATRWGFWCAPCRKNEQDIMEKMKYVSTSS